MKYLPSHFIIIFIIVSLSLILTSCCAAQKKITIINTALPETGAYFDGEEFKNIEETQLNEPVSFFKMLKKTFSGDQLRFPESPLPVKKYLPLAGDGDKAGLSATWIGHSTLLIQIDGFNILTDPVFSKRTFPLVGPKRFQKAPPVSIDQLPEIDAVVISHNHYDHLDRRSIKKLKHKARFFITPLKVGRLIQKWGVDPDKIVEMDWWSSFSPVKGLTITSTPSRHFSGRGMTDMRETLWSSWVIEGTGHNVFFSGDSGYTKSFKKIGRKFGAFDITFIECGAYDELWPDIHMTPEQSVQAHIDLNGKVMMPIHWGTFNLANHDWYEPVNRAVKESGTKGVTLTTPMPGETVAYGKTLPTALWWRDSSPGKLVVNKDGNLKNTHEAGVVSGAKP